MSSQAAATVRWVDVEVVRSARRRKTIEARLVDGVLQVVIPAWMSRAEEERAVKDMVRRFERRRAAEPIDLAARAEVLAMRYRLPQPQSIRWVDNQQFRWGSCTPVDRSIRISSRLAAFPSWVLDYVIVHELAHLVEHGHGPRFQALVDRYPKAERARGFLIAKGLDADGDLTSPEGAPEPAVDSRPRRPRPVIDAGAPTLTLW